MNIAVIYGGRSGEHEVSLISAAAIASGISKEHKVILIGISKEFFPFIFESFAREDNQINRENPSSGLGLNIAKKLLILMHGTIEITSEQGKGTKVHTSQPHRFCKKEDITKDNTLMSNI